MASLQAFVSSPKPLGSSWERLLPVSGASYPSPRVALRLRPRVQPQPWWPQKTGHYPTTLPPALVPWEAAIPAGTAGTGGRPLRAQAPVAQQGPSTRQRGRSGVRREAIPACCHPGMEQSPGRAPGAWFGSHCCWEGAEW